MLTGGLDCFQLVTYCDNCHMTQLYGQYDENDDGVILVQVDMETTQKLIVKNTYLFEVSYHIDQAGNVFAIKHTNPCITIAYMGLDLYRCKPHIIRTKRDHLCCIYYVQVQSIQSRTSE